MNVLHRLKSLQARLLVLLLGLVTLVWMGAAVMTWVDARHELDELLDGHLAQAAALLVVQQTRSDTDDHDGVADAPTLHKYAPKVAFQVFHEGALTLHSSNTSCSETGSWHNVVRSDSIMARSRISLMSSNRNQPALSI